MLSQVNWLFKVTVTTHSQLAKGAKELLLRWFARVGSLWGISWSDPCSGQTVDPIQVGPSCNPPSRFCGKPHAAYHRWKVSNRWAWCTSRRRLTRNRTRCRSLRKAPRVQRSRASLRFRWDFWTYFAKPKSMIFIFPSLLIRIFSGFRSRWMIPFSCK